MDNTNQPNEPEFAELDPVKATSFEADGHTYYIDRSSKLSLERNTWLGRFETYMLLGRDGNSFLRDIRRIYDANNQSRPGDVGVICDNLLKAAVDLMQKESPLLYLCTLFMNVQGEDKGAYDLDLAKQKIEHWQRARPIIPSDFFLAVALGYLRISRDTLSSLMATYSGLPLSNPGLPENQPNPS